VDDPTAGNGALLMEVSALGALHAALHAAGYRVIGPTVRDGAIALDELESAGDLPFGWGVELKPGGTASSARCCCAGTAPWSAIS